MMADESRKNSGCGSAGEGGCSAGDAGGNGQAEERNRTCHSVCGTEKDNRSDGPDLRVNIAGVELKNPVMTASGTFGSGEEYSEFVALNRLGAVVTKGVSDVPWEGNPVPRIAETPSGMLNAIGLQNPGIDIFVKRDIPFLKKFDTKIIVNVCGHTEKEYLNVVERLSGESVDLLEINISCPNVREGGIAFGQDPKAVEKITSAVKRLARQPVIMKLSPNVTDITVMAKAAESGGADAVSLINTLTGTKIDIAKRKFVLANRTGGLSGPAVKPVALRMVWQAANAVHIPVIGMGGIATADDAVEFILAGATAVSVGTANFKNPYATVQIVDGIRDYMVKYGINAVGELIGTVR
jgi:dihydroorotate dehydrogenase (NAD+) catalytic subunit